MIKRLTPPLLALLLANPLVAATAADVAGTVIMVAGRATALSPDGSIRQLAKNDPVFAGDVVSSGLNTYVNLKFADGAFFLLRPETRFQIEQYEYTATKAAPPPAAPSPPPAAAPAVKPAAPLVTAPQADDTSATSRAFFRLVKGGFRSVSGLIGKLNREDYRVTTPIATIGIRGTSYSARLCQGPCEDRDQLINLLRGAGKPVPSDETLLVTTVDAGAIELQTAQGSTEQKACAIGAGDKGGDSACSAVFTSSDGVTTVTPTRPLIEKNERNLDPASCT